MLLCLDVGNTHILGGVYDKEALVVRFRYATHLIGTADQFGMFLLNIFATYKVNLKNITKTVVASVVPGCDYTIQHTIMAYIKSPFLFLQPANVTAITIKYENPYEVGADRIANALGAIAAFPKQNIIIIDMGTATTLCVVGKNADYLGGVILPGVKLSMEALKSNTAKLMEVNIETPTKYIGRTTKESIQSGLYYGQLGALKEIIQGIKNDQFKTAAFKVIGTGGFASLFKSSKLFDVILPDLVLQGLRKFDELSIKNKSHL